VIDAAAGATLASGRYRLSERLGGGGMATVWLAEDTRLGRPVAVKLISDALASQEEFVKRFHREAKLAAGLSDANVVQVYDFGVEHGQPFLVMEYVEGGTLRDRRDPAPVSAETLARELLHALQHIHAAGIVHRDVKPANVFFDAAGNTKLGDFGSAHLADFGQTQTGGFFGTVAYMSPEQITGAPIGYSADLYALGATLVEALTGQPPFLGPDLVAQHLGEPPPRVSARRRGLSPLHDEVLSRALAKAPGERFASALEMAEAVAAWPIEGAAFEPPPSATAPAVAAPEATPPPERELWRSPEARLVLRHDPRTARDVLVEEHAAPLGGPALADLRATAAAGGPHVQRVLQLSDDRRAVSYEVVPGDPQPLAALTPSERATLGATLARLPAARVRGVALTAAGPVVLVAPDRPDGI
jgi:eukaryotic-like serine/threonine-protein kinase